MAVPTYATVISQINTYIVTNGNNEITANVLNPILKVITDFANNTIGNLDTLTTSDKTTVVNAINSLKLDFDNLNNNGVQLLTGYDDPNVTPPASFNYADFFMELDIMDDSPLQLWQWNGAEWTTYSSVYSKSEIDFIVSNIYDIIDAIPGVDYTPEDVDNKSNTYVVDGTGVKYYTADYVNALPKTLQEVTDAGATTTNPITVNQTGTGVTAIQGLNDSGTGVSGVSNEGAGVYGYSNTGSGVSGLSVEGAGVYGYSFASVGVSGLSVTGQGVVGVSNEGEGVSGVSSTATGVSGYSESGIAGLFNTITGLKIASFLFNGVEKVLIASDGTITAVGGTTANQVVVKSQLDTKQNQLIAGTNITIDVTDPLNPVISSSGGGGGGATNLAYTASPTNGIVTSDTGTDATLPLADATNAGLLKPAKYTLLEAITEAFTTALKTAYDSAVTWISTNGSTILSHLSSTSNPHGVTKTQVGLSNVDNTSDLTKFTNTALTGTPTAPTATLGTNTTQLATTAFVKENVDASVHWTKTGDNIRNNNFGNVNIDYGNLISTGYGIYGNKFIGSFFGFDTVSTNRIGISGNTFSFLRNGTIFNLSGTTDYITVPITINPTSGNAIVNVIDIEPTINQTGGANGITRAIYINPILTSAADFRAIEVVSGKVIVPNATASNEAVNKSQLDLKQDKGVRVTNATTTGSYAVNWSVADVWQLTLTGATTITDSNLPTGTATKVIELMVKGSFGLTLPAYWEAAPSSEAYNGTKWNHIVISCIVGTASSEKIIYSNEVLAT